MESKNSQRADKHRYSILSIRITFPAQLPIKEPEESDPRDFYAAADPGNRKPKRIRILSGLDPDQLRIAPKKFCRDLRRDE